MIPSSPLPASPEIAGFLRVVALGLVALGLLGLGAIMMITGAVWLRKSQAARQSRGDGA